MTQHTVVAGANTRDDPVHLDVMLVRGRLGQYQWCLKTEGLSE